MYSCDQDHTGTATRSGTKCQPCAGAAAAANSLHRYAARPLQQTTAGHGQASSGDHQDARQQPRRPARRRQYAPSSASSSRRSSTTVVATDVSNFRAMVQELTGFPPAAIFRPLPRRVHAASSRSAAHGCGGTSGGFGGAALHGGHSSETAVAAGRSSPDVQTSQQPLVHPPQCPPPGVFDFDGLADLGSAELDAWADLSFE